MKLPRTSKQWITPTLFIGIVIAQLRYISIHTQLLRYPATMQMSDVPPSNFTSTHTEATSSDNDIKFGFGACLMVKDDNDLLYEWIAYHYTVLSLRYLVIGSDVGSDQNVWVVLNRWNNVSLTSDGQLHYWILQPNDFIYRHNPQPIHELSISRESNSVRDKNTSRSNAVSDIKQNDHHALINRQKGFVTVCSEILKSAGVAWTLYVDSDEFVVWNPLSDDEEMQLRTNVRQRNAMNNRSYTMRKHFAELNTIHSTELNTIHSIKSMDSSHYDLVRQLQEQHDISECYTMPRLLVGALENRTCPERYGVSKVQKRARIHLGQRFMHMSTLRFFQHAMKGDFSRSKYGKVMMDLTKIDVETIRSNPPRNIHRPYPKHCVAAGGIYFPNSYFFILHYIGSWERYISRGSNDRRRNRKEWEYRASVDDGSMSACDSTVHQWLVRFQQLVGDDRTKYLLGVP